MSSIIEASDYFAIQHLVSSYVWALDTGDLATLSQLFTDDALLQDTSGTEHFGKDNILAYFSSLTRSAKFRGRQHHIDHPLFERTQEGYICRSYWTVTKWDAVAATKLIEVAGHSRDIYVNTSSGWLMRERRLYYWTSTDCPWGPTS